MRAIIYVPIVLFLTFSSGMAERKTLDKIHRQIPVGASEVLVPNPKRQDGYDQIIKDHQLKYDKKTGLYTYRYWKTDSTYVDLLYELSNRLDVTVACSVVYDGETDEYTYTYHIINSKDSVQPLRIFAVDIDRSLVIRTESGPWYYYSTNEPPPGSPKWVFWGSMGRDVSPGGSISLTLVSKQGPVIATCYSKGRARTFDHPVIVNALASPPANKEGVTGQTLGPGILNAENAQAQIEAFLQIAQTWGWVSTEKKGAALVHLSKGLDRNTFNALKNELNSNSGEVESEMAAFLEHFANKQGFGDD